MLRAIIFDFNGVIADDELAHFLCFQQALYEHGLSLTRNEYYGTYLGMDERTCTEALIQRSLGRRDPVVADAIQAKKARLFQESTAAAQPPLFEGVADFVTEAGKRYRLAIASGGRREQIALALKGAPIEQAFAVTVSCEDAPIGKPAPLIYQLALRRLNETIDGLGPALAPSECLVIEDSLAGIRSGHAARMKVVALATTYPADQLQEADLVLPILAGVSPERLEGLFL
jgi:HAD superfamily hydrolase (TIGR01509 family)